MLVFTMRFAFFYPDRSRGVYWSGPYQVPAKTVSEAKDILTDVVLKERDKEDSPLRDIRLLEVENRTTPCRAEEHYPDISRGVKEEINQRRIFAEQTEWRLHLQRTYPNGVPKHRDLDADWNW